ncbi:MAG: hypothetical protein JMM75_00550 [Candidatus Xiphinematobacter sp.]|nr:MAG: hypothetical protein JMM75_00550 [Candidatus Xiphinematobacter sp.]
MWDRVRIRERVCAVNCEICWGADIFTIATNLAGICGISVPCGFAKLDGSSLPIGVQFLGNALEEAKLLRLANAYELASGWTAHTAPL